MIKGERRTAASWKGMAILAIVAALQGCSWERSREPFWDDVAHYRELLQQTSYEDAACPSPLTPTTSGPPIMIDDTAPQQYWDLTLREAVELALANSAVIRELGGALVRSPDLVETIHQPSIRETDPNLGPEAALSEFDAVYSSNVLVEKNDRALNNQFTSGTQLLTQDLAVIPFQIEKASATGSRFYVRNRIDYDANNVGAANLFPHAWDWIVEAEVRQPLLQGAGVEFNRIYGPNGRLGAPRGVTIARLNTEVGLAEFQIALRDYISNVENVYWELYFAYRDLDAKLTARDASLEIWQRLRTLQESQRVRGENEARAREQYYRFQSEVQNTLVGRLWEPTRTGNGTTGGTFRGVMGVHVAERNLRLLIGINLADGRLIRPIEEPSNAEVLFQWEEISTEALVRRAELERQRRMVKRRELELTASKNFLQPRLDVISRYRWRGFGEDLMGGSYNGTNYEDALSNLFTGDFQEWALGMELTFPNGFRQAHAGVQNALLRLARERAVLGQQERQILHDLGNSLADMKRAYAIVQTNYNRRVAAQQDLDALQERERTGQEVDWDQLLESWRRVTDAEIQLHRSLVEYVMAVKNVHFEKGSLLDYNQIQFAENCGTGLAWPATFRARSEPIELAPAATPAIEPMSPSAVPVSATSAEPKASASALGPPPVVEAAAF
ncbi:MAG: TolC family protein [Pirellulaceae bacterium]|nr:TolC family protein [Pirellulaceae bacterium]